MQFFNRWSLRIYQPIELLNLYSEKDRVTSQRCSSGIHIFKKLRGPLAIACFEFLGTDFKSLDACFELSGAKFTSLDPFATSPQGPVLRVQTL